MDINKIMYEDKPCIRCKNIFSSNKIIVNDDTCRVCERLNCISYWFPVLYKYQLPVPKTSIIHFNFGYFEVTEDKKVVNDLAKKIKLEAAKIGTPAFLRTGMTSNKHDWVNSCYLKTESIKEIKSKINNLIEFSSIMTIDRMSSIDFWAVRELLKTKRIFSYFAGSMPITREFRYFFRNGKVECRHPYWPKGVFKNM